MQDQVAAVRSDTS